MALEKQFNPDQPIEEMKAFELIMMRYHDEINGTKKFQEYWNKCEAYLAKIGFISPEGME